MGRSRPMRVWIAPDVGWLDTRARKQGVGMFMVQCGQARERDGWPTTQRPSGSAFAARRWRAGMKSA